MIWTGLKKLTWVHSREEEYLLKSIAFSPAESLISPSGWSFSWPAGEGYWQYSEYLGENASVPSCLTSAAYKCETLCRLNEHMKHRAATGGTRLQSCHRCKIYSSVGLPMADKRKMGKRLPAYANFLIVANDAFFTPPINSRISMTEDWEKYKICMNLF